jgi:hypothetical protein
MGQLNSAAVQPRLELIGLFHLDADSTQGLSSHPYVVRIRYAWCVECNLRQTTQFPAV